MEGGKGVGKKGGERGEGGQEDKGGRRKRRKWEGSGCREKNEEKK